MTVKAPQDGIVVYRTNWRDEKKKVGDSMWFGETVLAMPDLTEMRAEAFVDEADGGAVAAGQKIVLRLEARPDLDILGRVKTVGRTVRQKSWRTPGKVYRVDVALDAHRSHGDASGHALPRRDRDRPDPGPPAGAPRRRLPARGPARGVGPARLGWKEVPVRLGRSNRRQVEVLSGLAEGDRLSPTDLAAPVAETRQASGPQ